MKVLFNFYSSILDEHTNETMWAEVVDVTKGHYKINNIPFYVPSLASGDVVFAEYDETELMLTYRETIEYSGNSTIHVILMDDKLAINDIREIFDNMGCISERFSEKYLALEIPFKIDYIHIKRKLDEMENDELIGYAETCLSDEHRQNVLFK